MADDEYANVIIICYLYETQRIAKFQRGVCKKLINNDFRKSLFKNYRLNKSKRVNLKDTIKHF